MAFLLILLKKYDIISYKMKREKEEKKNVTNNQNSF